MKCPTCGHDTQADKPRGLKYGTLTKALEKRAAKGDVVIDITTRDIDVFYRARPATGFRWAHQHPAKALLTTDSTVMVNLLSGSWAVFRDGSLAGDSP